MIRELIAPTLGSINSCSSEILCISDTSEINYEAKRGRITDVSLLGYVGNGIDLGYLIHPTLCVTPHGEIVGIGDYYTWNRSLTKVPETQSTASKANRKLFADKETSRWLASCERLASQVADKSRLTFIQDREGDIYNVLSGIDSMGSRYVIRSQHDRIVDGEDGEVDILLKEALSHIEAAGHIQVDIAATAKRTARLATLAVKWVKLRIKRPRREMTAGLPEYIEVNIVDLQEVNYHLPAKEKPISWRLLTNFDVDTFEDAIDIVEKYRKRWLIEEYFKIIKSGFELEDSEMETSEGLRKLGAMTAQAAVKVLMLRQAGKEKTEIPISEVLFTEQQVKCLEAVNKRVEGKTEKQKNPYKPRTIAWAYWIIARLGNWDAYASSSKPGILTIWNGLVAFDRIYLGWSITYEDV